MPTFSKSLKGPSCLNWMRCNLRYLTYPRFWGKTGLEFEKEVCQSLECESIYRAVGIPPTPTPPPPPPPPPPPNSPTPTTPNPHPHPQPTTQGRMRRHRACLNIKTVFPGIGIPIIKMRRLWDRLIFKTGIHILVRWHLYIEMAPVIGRDWRD